MCINLFFSKRQKQLKMENKFSGCGEKRRCAEFNASALDESKLQSASGAQQLVLRCSRRPRAESAGDAGRCCRRASGSAAKGTFWQKRRARLTSLLQRQEHCAPGMCSLSRPSRHLVTPLTPDPDTQRQPRQWAIFAADRPDNPSCHFCCRALSRQKCSRFLPFSDKRRADAPDRRACSENIYKNRRQRRTPMNFNSTSALQASYLREQRRRNDAPAFFAAIIFSACGNWDLILKRQSCIEVA